MRVARAALLVACAAVLGAGCRPAVPASHFVELEHRWVAALQAHDTAALDRLLDDSFVDATFRGAIRHKRDVLTGSPAGGPYHSVRLDDVVVRRYGRTAINEHLEERRQAQGFRVPVCSSSSSRILARSRRLTSPRATAKLTIAARLPPKSPPTSSPTRASCTAARVTVGR